MSADDAQLGHGLAPGSEVPGYRILRVLGAGGFGITYLAEHLDIGNLVAVKEFLPAGIAARAADGLTVRPVSQGTQQDFAWGLERFRQEARTLGALDHPNIVRVLNFVQANGTAYTVMDFVEGESLGAKVAKRLTLPPAELAALVPGLLAGLEAVHRAGLLHRDLKPDNVILRTNGTPVLIDFGAARQALGAHSRSLTTVLSEGYAPYEQYDPHGNQGTWTDIYALGGTLYRCVTGEKPVPAPRRIDARVKNKPDPLMPIRQLARGPYGPGLLAAIEASLALVEDERPQDVPAFRAALGAPMPLSARAETAIGRDADTLVQGTASRRGDSRVFETRSASGAPPVRARRGLRLALAAGLLVMMGGGAAAGYVAIREHNAKVAADDAERERLAAEAAERERQERLARERIAELERQKAEEERKRREAEEARRQREEEEARRRAEEERRKAEDERRRAEDEERRKDAELRQARDDHTAGRDAYNRKDYDESIRRLTRAIESGRLSGPELGNAYNDRGRAYHIKGLFDLAIADYTQAIRLNPGSFHAYRNRALIWYERRDYDRVIADMDEAIRRDPGFALSYETRGNAWFQKRDYDRAIGDYTEMLRLMPSSWVGHYNRGLAWHAKGDRARALADFRAALRLDPGNQKVCEALRRLEPNRPGRSAGGGFTCAAGN